MEGGALDDQFPFRGSTPLLSSASPPCPQAPVQRLPHPRDQQGHLLNFPCHGPPWLDLPPPSPPPPCPAACPPTRPPCGRPTGPPLTRNIPFTWPGLGGSSDYQHTTLHLSIISWRPHTGLNSRKTYQCQATMLVFFRLANIQRTLLESGAESTTEGENGAREEEVIIFFFEPG